MSKKIARDLNPVNMENRIYQVENEAEVIKSDIAEISEKLPVANPEAEATDTLEKVTIDGVVYEVGGGEDLSDILPEEYDPTQTYNIGDVVKYEGKIYYIGMNNVTGEFDPAMTSKYINRRIPATDIKNKKIFIYSPTATYDAVNKILTVDITSNIDNLKTKLKRVLSNDNPIDTIRFYPSYESVQDLNTLDIEIYFENPVAGIGLDTDFKIKVLIGKNTVTLDGTTLVSSIITGIVNTEIPRYCRSLRYSEAEIIGIYGSYPNNARIEKCTMLENGSDINSKSMTASVITNCETITDGYLQEIYALFDVKGSILKDIQEYNGKSIGLHIEMEEPAFRESVVIE